MITILIVLSLLTQPLTAVWERPNIARVTWSGPGCLWKGQTFIQCYESSGTLLLGASGPLDHAYRPTAFDVFRLVRSDGTVEQTQIKSVVYLAVWR